MNIKEATIHIKNTIIAYLEKNEDGSFFIPVEKQRPVFLYGPPGIGKTAVMEQIANELGIGLVSYSMTHHTRQSAIGLPFIAKKIFDEKEYSVSEYTMSEILASVYNYIEETGKKEGILFLDEINCVSETLAPSMLRFLQYKTFGSHEVPKGWIVVTAGNPPEYNKSVREYDIATLDRIKKIDVEASYDVWKEYAINNNVHPAILAFLDIKKNCFYSIENTPAGKKFVTARGWEDLSRIMCLYEKKSLIIDASLIEQYIQSPSIAQDFSSYYSAFKKLKDVFDTEKILNGCFDDTIIEETKNLNISEKLGLINTLSDCITLKTKYVITESNSIKETLKLLKDKDTTAEEKNNIKRDIERLKINVSNVQSALSNVVEFIKSVFGDSPETEIFISNITLNKNAAAFLMSFGCESFARISDKSEYEKKINEELDILI
ncbi:MAG: AAA family ATPase [Ruminococcaceae bacterium]|nr:AAA family ATPase [Oscillospiraceae bacterium]